MADISNQIKNIKSQLKILDMQLDNISMQILNMMGMPNISSQIQNIGIQMLNLGTLMINIGIDMPDYGMQIPNLYFQIQNIDMQIQNIGNKINMKNNMNGNMNMMNQNMEFQNMMLNVPMIGKLSGNMKNNDYNEWNLIFYNSDNNIHTSIQISPEKTVREAINLYRIKSFNSSEQLNFIFNNLKLVDNLKIKESDLRNGSKILVYEMGNIVG